MVRVRTCDYTGQKIEPGTGIMYVKNDGTVLNFINSKAEKLYKREKDPREVEWTKIAQEYNKSTSKDEVSIEDRILEREEQVEGEFPPLGANKSNSYLRLYEEFISSDPFTAEDVNSILNSSYTFKTPGEIEHDILRIRRELREGDLSNTEIREIARKISESLVGELPSDTFSSEPDPHMFADRFVEELKSHQTEGSEDSE